MLLSITFAVGVLLTASPWLWPRRARADSDASRERRGLRVLLAEAGVGDLPPALFVGICLAAAVVLGALGLLLSRLPVVGVLAATVGVLAPVLILRIRRSKRIEARRAMWPDVCDLLVASVRSGMGLPDAVASLAESAPTALRPAFASFRRDIAASGHFDTSILALKRTLSDATADRIIETLRMARQVGGTELPSVLRALSSAVRSEVVVRGEVAARQSWIRGAAVIGVIAPWAILGMLLTRPEGASAYNTPQGVVLIIVAAIVSVVAYRIMVRIGRLPEPKRWFGTSE